MARELVDGGADDGGTGPIAKSKSTDTEPVLLRRRGYMQLGASALVGIGGASLVSPGVAAEAEEFETIELAPGEQPMYTIEAGETFENVLIDQTAEDSMFSLIVEEGADEWAIRNVGWKGVAPLGGNREHTFLLNVSGDGLIENIFIDQRNHHGGVGSDVGAIWTDSSAHHGHIECRHNFIAGCGNNATYDSGDGWSHHPASGSVTHEYCYHRDNAPSNFRPGKAESVIRNCVSIAYDPEGTRGPYPGNHDTTLSRACWAWHNPGIVMENCAIWWDPDDIQPAAPFWATHRGGSEGDRCDLHIINCDINESWEATGGALMPTAAGGNGSDTRNVVFEDLGTDPDISVLGEGVPTTPEMAARGQRNLPPELGSEPSGGVGEFEDPEPDEDFANTAESTERVERYAAQPDPGYQGAARPQRTEATNTRSANEDGSTDERPQSDQPEGMLTGSAIATLGVTGYLIGRRVGWDL